MNSIKLSDLMPPSTYRNGLSSHGAVITDRRLTMKNIHEAAFGLLCHGVVSLLEDEQGEDESIEAFEARKRLEKECIYPGADLCYSIRLAVAASGQEGARQFVGIVDSVYEQVCRTLLVDARKMGGKFPDFAILMNRHEQWFSYAMSLNGHGISPLDRPEIADWLDENDIELSGGCDEIGFGESLSIVQMLSDGEMTK
jgi:hypothetical protein